MNFTSTALAPNNDDGVPAYRPFPRTKGSALRLIAGIILVIAAAVLYMLTLDNGLQPGELHGGDLITHQYAQVQARPSNAPGYPIYTMGGWLWFHAVHLLKRALGVPFPNPIPILSSYSTLWALLSLWLLYRIVCMSTESHERPVGNWPLAFLISMFYAVTYFFWYYATTTEQYSSAIAQTLAIVLLLMVWLRRQDSLSLLFALAFLCGLSLAHMLTVAFIVPPTVAAVLWVKPRLLRDWKAIAGCMLAAALPLLAYVFVYVRGAAHPEWWGSQQYASTWQWFWSFVSTAQGREELMWAFEPGRPFFGNGFPALIGHELTWFLVAAGLVGFAFLRRPMPFVLYGTLFIYLLFSWAYRFGNWFQVILPAYALIMIGVGALADRWQRTVAASMVKSSGGHWRRFVAAVSFAAPILVLAAMTIWRFDTSLARADSRNRSGDDALDRAAILLSGSLPLNAAVFASVDDLLALQYLTEIWGIRPDIQTVSSDRARDLVNTQPVYVTWDAAATLEQELNEEGDLSLRAVSPDWAALYAAAQVSSALGAQDGDSGNELFGASSGDLNTVFNAGEYSVELHDELLPGVVLDSYSVRPSPTGSPVTESTDVSYDVNLNWRLDDADWPEHVAISVRPTVGGEYLRDPDEAHGVLSNDHAEPAQLLFDAGPSIDMDEVVDPYRIRFPLADVPAPDYDAGSEQGFAIVLYRRLSDGFEDIARRDYPIATDAVRNVSP